ncbi:ABC transporter ATP-binding protein [Arthrobacter sp. zg-ZUI100]|uniref:ABC transporter ATP-binding protein n=1 Tax=Arthrobacter jiangjiafuii TaxID=2817475 RepID=UPI001AED1E40|nr:ABC transporter ATP-binding protein [Arthrobacter jiangjiafuii]MBP3037176.1 ABC transporter ATP-binding protein [Arthrobacter jiangjiafuii]
MPSLTFDGLTKSFGSNTVIREFNATIDDNEFLVLLGPSGCGKSTMLRMIAGLTEITSGQLRFDATVVNDLTPKQRGIAFVFQSYALYPHMTVRANIAFPLLMDNFRWWHHLPIVGGIVRRQLMKRSDISEKVERTAEMLELTDYLERRPKALSGGQRQRVAVARSIVREPSLYLFDEPLSNLDAKLRMQMRAEISALHARVKKTFVYVTHDQVEAMTMGTRIIVMNAGIVQQLGTPREIYETPANVFVARFIGSPPMNIFPATVSHDGLSVDGVEVENSAALAAVLRDRGLESVSVGVRAEKFGVNDLNRPAAGGSPLLGFKGHTMLVEHLGAETVVGFKAGAAPQTVDVGAAASQHLHYARMPGEQHFGMSENCYLSFSGADVHLFHPETGERIEH